MMPLAWLLCSVCASGLFFDQCHGLTNKTPEMRYTNRQQRGKKSENLWKEKGKIFAKQFRKGHELAEEPENPKIIVEMF